MQLTKEKQVDATTDETASRRIQMMLIDDEEMMLELLVDLFSTQWDNIEVKPYSSSEKAMEAIARNKVDIIITDLMMPSYSGIDILREAKKRYPEVLVVLITAFGSLETTLEAIDYGAYDYLTKPFQVQEFELMVKNAVERIELSRRMTSLRAVNQDLGRHNQELTQEIDSLRRQLSRHTYAKEQEERLPGLQAASSPPPAEADKQESLSQYARLARTPRALLKRQLEELDQRKRKGELNDEEHEEAKRRLLQTHFS
ncbi:response regulator [Candidatus Sumerlaeota bacterium]